MLSGTQTQKPQANRSKSDIHRAKSILKAELVKIIHYSWFLVMITVLNRA